MRPAEWANAVGVALAALTYGLVGSLIGGIAYAAFEIVFRVASGARLAPSVATDLLLVTFPLGFGFLTAGLYMRFRMK